MSMDYFNGDGWEEETNYDWQTSPPPPAAPTSSTIKPLSAGQWAYFNELAKDIYEQMFAEAANQRTLINLMFHEEDKHFHGNYYTDYKGV